MEKRKYVKYNRPKEVSRNEEDMIFGTRALIETIKSGKQIEKIFVQKGLNNELFSELNELIRQHRLGVSKVPVEKLNRLTRKNHQGVIAFVSPVTYVPLHNIVASSYENGRTPLVLILDRITDVRNFGAICRTAECTGVNAVVIPSKGGALINSDAVKTSAGALNYLSICKEDNLLNTVTYLKDSGFQVIACTEKTDKLIFDMEYNIPTAIIVGSEEDGISDELIRVSDESAKIPLHGEIGSLNVSVAAAVVLYECLRQRI
ncbi:MAG: 23S rRNA (guanosine(2251)-2'-O)-methyltransferase RlmB [Cyclobacteriaceae bacterium]